MNQPEGHPHGLNVPLTVLEEYSESTFKIVLFGQVWLKWWELSTNFQVSLYSFEQTLTLYKKTKDYIAAATHGLLGCAIILEIKATLYIFFW